MRSLSLVGLSVALVSASIAPVGGAYAQLQGSNQEADNPAPANDQTLPTDKLHFLSQIPSLSNNPQNPSWTLLNDVEFLLVVNKELAKQGVHSWQNTLGAIAEVLAASEQDIDRKAHEFIVHSGSRYVRLDLALQSDDEVRKGHDRLQRANLLRMAAFSDPEIEEKARLSNVAMIHWLLKDGLEDRDLPTFQAVLLAAVEAGSEEAHRRAIFVDGPEAIIKDIKDSGKDNMDRIKLRDNMSRLGSTCDWVVSPGTPGLGSTPLIFLKELNKKCQAHESSGYKHEHLLSELSDITMGGNEDVARQAIISGLKEAVRHDQKVHENGLAKVARKQMTQRIERWERLRGNPFLVQKAKEAVSGDSSKLLAFSASLKQDAPTDPRLNLRNRGVFSQSLRPFTPGQLHTVLYRPGNGNQVHLADEPTGKDAADDILHNANFLMLPALNNEHGEDGDRSCFTLTSPADGHVLTLLENRRVGMRPAPQGDAVQETNAASWCIHDGLAERAVSLESGALRGNFLRHYGGKVYVVNPNGQNGAVEEDFDNQHLLKEDATWNLADPNPRSIWLAELRRNEGASGE